MEQHFVVLKLELMLLLVDNPEGSIELEVVVRDFHLTHSQRLWMSIATQPFRVETD